MFKNRDKMSGIYGELPQFSEGKTKRIQALRTAVSGSHISDHNFVHTVLIYQMQQILAKPGLFHTASSTSSASIVNSGIKAHGLISQTFYPPLLDYCNNNIANCFTHTIHKLWHA